ncbi:carbohydrate ABC transporter permease [Breznakiella homolactica]|uniref:Sugar ABC transporter permease n=1 Tax=Breznakiella homolactica TaxID=2798577 RepID=A0A7T8B9N4_9SPIR|nr:sugar ABC transporter permease [Breznakiella homolactica]QQO08135.1 sugar ABC transporter permease [Breznakiella homolactica]
MKSHRKLRTYILGYVLILPSMLFLISFTYYPVVRSFVLSLFRQVPGAGQSFIGFGNYAEMFGTELFRQVMWNNLIYSLGSTIPSIILGLIFALLLNGKIRGRGFFRFSFFYPTMIPIAAASMVWIFLFTQSYGLVNKILGILHLPSNIDWLNSTPYAMVAIICVSIWKFAGYYMLLFLSGLQSIDPSYYEAALLEGASTWQKTYKITLPLLSPTTFFIVLMAIINSFQSVDQIYVMTRGGPYNTTNVLLYYIYQYGFVYWDTGTASTASSVLFIILLIITVIYYRGLQHFVSYER